MPTIGAAEIASAPAAGAPWNALLPFFEPKVFPISKKLVAGSTAQKCREYPFQTREGKVANLENSLKLVRVGLVFSESQSIIRRLCSVLRRLVLELATETTAERHLISKSFGGILEDERI